MVEIERLKQLWRQKLELYEDKIPVISNEEEMVGWCLIEGKEHALDFLRQRICAAGPASLYVEAEKILVRLLD